MKDKVKVMIKNVVEENAVGFKNSTANALYQKVSDRLKEEYKNIAKNTFLKKKLTEEATMISSNVSAAASPESAMTVDDPLGLPPGPPISGDGPPIPRGPNGEQGMTLDEFVKQYHRKKEDFDSREEWTEWLKEYYKQMVDLLQQWDREYQWRRRNNTIENRPKPMKIPSWKQFKQKEEQQPLPKRWLDQPT
jgi:hypothetical protein